MEKCRFPMDSEHFYRFTGWSAYQISDSILHALPLNTETKTLQSHLQPGEYVTIHKGSDSATDMEGIRNML